MCSEWLLVNRSKDIMIIILEIISKIFKSLELFEGCGGSHSTLEGNKGGYRMCRVFGKG